MYEQVCEEFGWPVDTALLQQMKATNEQKLKELDGKIEDAEKNLGETEVRDFMLEKALYLTRIGAKVYIGLVSTFSSSIARINYTFNSSCAVSKVEAHYLAILYILPCKVFLFACATCKFSCYSCSLTLTSLKEPGFSERRD